MENPSFKGRDRTTMVSIPVYNRSGQEVGTYELDPAELAPRISKQLLHDVVVMYQASQRQGTQKTKTRGEVAGTTKKMYRQFSVLTMTPPATPEESVKTTASARNN